MSEGAFRDVVRGLDRLRAAAGNDQELQREIQDLERRAMQLDPKHRTNDPRLQGIIQAQVLTGVEQIELMLRKKLDSTRNSIRSNHPANMPPGYSQAVAEYYKRLSKQ